MTSSFLTEKGDINANQNKSTSEESSPSEVPIHHSRTCSGRDAENGSQSRPFLPPFHRYIDTLGFYGQGIGSKMHAQDKF
jgi:hypothetical protein